MKDRETLNRIFETVYQKNIPQKENFLKNYDRSDCRLIEENESSKFLIATRKANNISELCLDKRNCYSSKIVYSCTIESYDFEDMIINKGVDFFTPEFLEYLEMYEDLPDHGWVEVKCDKNEYPNFYFNTEGYNYLRYIGIRSSDADKWRELKER